MADIFRETFNLPEEKQRVTSCSSKRVASGLRDTAALPLSVEIRHGAAATRGLARHPPPRQATAVVAMGCSTFVLMPCLRPPNGFFC